MTDTQTGLERALARARELHADHPSSGPMAQMMAHAGFSAAHIAGAGESFRRNFLEPDAIGNGVMHDEDTRRFVRSFREVARDMNMAALDLDEWIVEVDWTDRTVANECFVVETMSFALAAHDHHEARLIAFRWAAWLIDELCTGENMIVATRIID